MGIEQHVAVVIPWRPGPGRWYAYGAVREFYARHFPDWPVYEADTDAPVFNLSAARNAGLEAATADAHTVVVVNDADTIPEAWALTEAVGWAAQGKMVLPYTLYRVLGEHGSDMHRRGVPITDCGYVAELDWSCSGVYVASCYTWQDFQFDERFEGWNPEDFAMRYAYETLRGEPQHRIGARVFAFDHPSQVKDGHEQEAGGARLALYREAHERGDKAAMRALIDPPA